MAIAIKAIPTLKEKVAEQFVKKAKSASKNKGSVNFSKQIQSTSKILAKAKMQ